MVGGAATLRPLVLRPRLGRLHRLDRTNDPFPHRGTIEIATVEHCVRAHRRVYAGVIAVLIDHQLRRAVDVFVVHAAFVLRDAKRLAFSHSVIEILHPLRVPLFQRLPLSSELL